MEYVDGQTLASMFREGIHVDYHRFACWGAAIAEGLHAAHMTDVVHRDLKPENIMIREDDTPALLDFGVAKYFSQDAKLTAQDAVVGTLLYMAPEQFHSVTDPRSDQYALGLILAQLATGEVPRACDPTAKGIYIERVTAAHPYHLRDHAPDAPRTYARIVDRLLATAPDGRYPTGAHVVDAFRTILDPAKIDTRLSDAIAIETRSILKTERIPESQAKLPVPRAPSSRSVRTAPSLATSILLAIAFFIWLFRTHVSAPGVDEGVPVQTDHESPSPGQKPLATERS